MNTFKIGETEFGIGKLEFSIEDSVMNIEIVGDEDIFNKITEDDDSEWGWAMDAPKLYFNDIPYNGNKVTADDDLYEQCDFALYMMEHNDFSGEIEVTDSTLRITGEADIMGDVYPVYIEADISE